MKPFRRITVTAVIVVLIAVLVWQSVAGVRTSIRISCAYEQTETFYEMVEKAAAAIRQNPPNVNAAVAFLQYTHNYYPSGTKQATGSHLDRIVERSRLAAELEIIEMLRVATGAHLGTEVEAWIGEFGNQAVSDK